MSLLMAVAGTILHGSCVLYMNPLNIHVDRDMLV